MNGDVLILIGLGALVLALRPWWKLGDALDAYARKTIAEAEEIKRNAKL